MTYNVSSWNMPLKVEFDIYQITKFREDILKFIMELELLSSYNNLESYGPWKLTSKLGFRQNDL